MAKKNKLKKGNKKSAVKAKPKSKTAKAKAKATVTFKDSCHCIKCHAEYRWTAKTDEEEMPSGTTSAAITPSDVGAFKGPGGVFDKDTPRRARTWAPPVS